MALTGAEEARTLEARLAAIEDRLEIYNLIAGHPVRPSLRTPTGDPIHVRMRAEKCFAIAESGRISR